MMSPYGHSVMWKTMNTDTQASPAGRLLRTSTAVTSIAARFAPRAMSAARRNLAGSAGRARWAGWACALALVALAGCEQAAPAEGGTGAGAQPRQAGDRFRDCPGCPEVVVVPAGSFQMGSPTGEQGRDGDETRRSVTIRAAFAVGVREVTFAEWDACVSAGGCGGYRPADGGWGRGRQPVINVSWDDARAYAAWLSRTTGAQYRLLTEAEWEYAARAGTTTPFHTGATIATGQANYDGRAAPYGSGVPGQYRGRPIAAGSLARNSFGLYDVHGNVAEMVADCYDAGDTGCTRRVVRGGSWASAPRLLRSAYRSWCAPALRSPQTGFRIARNL